MENNSFALFLCTVNSDISQTIKDNLAISILWDKRKISSDLLIFNIPAKEHVTRKKYEAELQCKDSRWEKTPFKKKWIYIIYQKKKTAS